MGDDLPCERRRGSLMARSPAGWVCSTITMASRRSHGPRSQSTSPCPTGTAAQAECRAITSSFTSLSTGAASRPPEIGGTHRKAVDIGTSNGGTRLAQKSSAMRAAERIAKRSLFPWNRTRKHRPRSAPGRLRRDGWSLNWSDRHGPAILVCGVFVIPKSSYSRTYRPRARARTNPFRVACNPSHASALAIASSDIPPPPAYPYSMLAFQQHDLGGRRCRRWRQSCAPAAVDLSCPAGAGQAI